MFGAGWTEMLIIGVVALIVIGPKDLPVVMRKIGRVVGTVRRMGSEFQRELNKTTGLDQIADLRRSITEPLRQTSEEISREFNKVTAAGVEPSGIIKPTDPKVESVYDQIVANSAAPTDAVAPIAPPPVMKPLASVEPSPAPAEASVMPPAAPAKPKRTPKPKAPGAIKAVAGAPAARTAAAPKAAIKPAAKPRAKSAAAKAPAASITASDTASKPAAKPARPRAKKA